MSLVGGRAWSWGLLVALAWVALPAWGQTPRLRAFIKPDSKITDTQAVQLVLQVEGAESPRIAPPRLGSLKNLTVISGPSTNSSFLWSGGKASARFQVIYTLLPQGPGPAEIPAMDVEIDGVVQRTEPIRFEVEAAPPGAPGAPVPGDSQDPSVRAGADVFVRAELSDDEVWVGQPVTVEVTVYAAARITDIDWSQEPTFGNFWVEHGEVFPQDESYRTRIDGRIYTAYPVERSILIPPSAGEFEIGSWVARLQVRLSGNDLFDMLSFGRSQAIIRRTAPLQLTVRDLPPDPPAGFSGAVGSFEMNVELDRARTAVNDAVALRATVSGEGSLRSVEPPRLEAPSGLKVFEPRLTESVSQARKEVRSSRTWEWILVPLTPGELRVPPLRFAFFDPQSGTYRQAEGEPLRLAVDRAEAGSETPVARGGIELQRQDLAFIKPLRGELRMETRRAHETTLFLASLGLPLFLAPLWVVVERMRQRRDRDQGRHRARRARARARRKLQSAGKRLAQSDSATYHAEVARALVGYVADRYGLAAAGLTYDRVDELLASRGVEPELRRRFRSCLETCDFARFVPSASESGRRSEVLEEALAVVDELERTR